MILEEMTGCEARPLIVSERFPSGQREQTVNLPAQPSEVRILPSPPRVTTTLVGDSGDRDDLRTIIARYYTLPYALNLRNYLVLQALVWGLLHPYTFGPVIRYALARAHVAQLVEHFLGKEEVHRFKPGRGLHFL